MSAPPSSFESTPKFRLTICGAGIGGLVLAITVGKYDPSILIDLYEGRDSIDTGGLGILISKKIHEVLIELGLFDEFKQISCDLEHSRSPKIRRSDIREGGYHWFHRPAHHGISPMHHQHMVTVLKRHLPPSCTVHPKKRLVNYTEPEEEEAHPLPIRLEFTDGTSATTDVLIGADGIRSAVRKKMFEAAFQDNEDSKTDLKQYIDATFTGMSVYRSLISAETLGKQNPENPSLKDMTMYTGKGMSLVTYPIAEGSIINVAAFVCDPSSTGTHFDGRWVSDVTRDELVEHFDNFEPDARTVLELCEKPTKWALHVVKPLPFCARNRVALVGDACHAMTNHFGAGTVQAIGDAFILGRLLAHPLTQLSRVHDALLIYEDIRLPVARTLASLSLSTGWMYSFMAPGYYDGTRNGNDLDDCGIGSYEREGMETIKQEILKGWNVLHESSSTSRAWVDAELKLQALAGRMSN